MRQWGLPLGAVLLLVLAATVALARPDVVPGGEGHKAPGLIAQLVDEDGQALARLAVRVDGRPVTADADGFVRTPMGGGPELVTVTAPDRLPRTQAVAPGVATVVRLTAADPGTVSVRFGGDVMFGRRFYDRDEDGDRSDGLLDTDPSVAEHAALLSEVRPLLEDADLTVVNLESALTERPWTDPTGPRPEGLHPTKDLVLTSAPESAEALVDSGVDAVSLGNDHVYDALAAGMDSTLTALDGAGLAHFGAGRTVDEAWAPAYLERRGQRLALLGCTTVTGAGEGIPHVAGPAQGGAAECSTERLDRAVRDARASADVVVVMVHGGVEYADRQADAVEQLSATATAAGAALVVDGHPHVVGGVSVTRTALIAETMGNLLSDQRIWPSSLSYLLRVDVRDGAPVQATVDPLLLEDYVPRPTVGLLADAAARRAAGLTGDPGARLGSPGAVFTAADPPPAETRRRHLEAGQVVRLAPGWWPQDPAARVGEDLLWSGSFEDMDTDASTTGAHGWTLGPTAHLTGGAACSGAVGVRLRRSPGSTEDVLVTPGHRQLVTAGAQVSLVADVRSASRGASLELRWYKDTRGGSNATTRVAVPERSRAAGCQQVRLDATVPEGAVAVQPAVRLSPTGDVQIGTHVSVDDVMLVAWAALGESGRRWSVVDAAGTGDVRLTQDPGAPGEPVAAPPVQRPGHRAGAASPSGPDAHG